MNEGTLVNSARCGIPPAKIGGLPPWPKRDGLVVTMRPTSEKRRYRRLDLSVPVLFAIKSRTGTGVTRTGVTRDVSPGGIFFRTESAQDVEPNQELTIKLLIPRQADPSEATVSLSGEARVVRTERLTRAPGVLGDPDERWGVAAQFTRRPSVDLSTINNLFARALGARPPQQV